MKKIIIMFLISLCFFLRIIAQENVNIFNDTQNAIESADINCNDDYILTGGAYLRLWDCVEKRSSHIFHYDKDKILCVKFYGKNSNALIATANRRIIFYNLKDEEVLYLTEEIQSLVYSIQVVDNIAFLGCADGSIYKVDLESYSIKIIHKNQHPIVGMKVVDGFIYYVDNLHLVVINVGRGNQIKEIDIKGSNSIDVINNIVFIGCYGGKVAVVRDFKKIKSITTCLVGAVKHLGYNEYVLLYGEDQNIQLWDFKKEVLLYTFKGHVLPVTAVLVNDKKKEFYSVSRDGTVRFWNYQQFVKKN
ncbi:MAG TPA: hypothetical protein PLV94_05000 [Spirochaetota bacterium]|nr:hypothetical protein [Spirochaetota bacterium]